MDPTQTPAAELIRLVDELVRYGFLTAETGTRILELTSSHGVQQALVGIGLGERRARRQQVAA